MEEVDLCPSPKAKETLNLGHMTTFHDYVFDIRSPTEHLSVHSNVAGIVRKIRITLISHDGYFLHEEGTELVC